MQIKTFLLLNFCLQGNHKVSVYSSSLTIHLDLTPKSVKLYTIFLHLDSILAPNPQWGSLQCSLISPRCWNYSLNWGLLLKEKFEPFTTTFIFWPLIHGNRKNFIYLCPTLPKKIIWAQGVKLSEMVQKLAEAIILCKQKVTGTINLSITCPRFSKWK